MSSEGVTIDTSEQNAMYIKMVGSEGRRSSTGGSSIVEECLRRRLSAGDWSLLQLAATPPQRHVPRTGRFLTMHKRRRKRLTTRTLGAEHTAILDDVTHGQVQCILDRCGLWAFNAFALETAAGGRSLSVLCVHLFHWYGLLDHFQLDVVRVWKLFTLIEEGYHSTNPYHNSIHAADVTQAMHCFLQEEKIRKHMTPLEVMASLLGAVAHDLDHPGVNQPFLIATSNHLAALYGNMSVLENHHWRSAVGCLLESGVAEQLTPWRDTLESQIRSLILATDITRQQEFINRLKNGIDDNTLDMRNEEDRHFILQIALKCADISNPTRPWDVSRKWSLKVCEEFFRQGDFERRLNLPVTSLCDRNSTSVPKIQSGFFRFVVTPLFTEWHRFLLSDLSYKMMDLLHSNQKRWEVLEAAENAEETQTELSDAEPEQILSEGSSEKGSSETLLPADFIPRQSTPRISSSSRRHSVPVNVARCLLPRSNTRRESLPPQARLPALANDIHHRLVNSNINEGDELLFGSQLSLMSTDSLNAIHHSSSSAPDKEERPLSAETLLPDLSITSMTAVGFTSGPKCLTRQQTFPPLQPYIRARYLSTTAEMSSCREILLEGGSNSNSSHSSEENLGNEPSLRGVSVLSSSNNRGPEMFIAELQYKPPPVQAQAGSKRGESSERTEKDKASKMAKLSDGPLRGQKENVDPKRNLLNGLARRGSAPVTSIFNRPEEPIVPPNNLLRVDAGNLRRGSMPADVAPQRSNEQEDVQIDPVLSRITSSQSEPLNCQYPRRGSMPAEIPSELRRTELITRHCTSLNGKAGRRKKQLRRRSSGGPETVCLLPELSDNAAWLRWRREIVRRSDINPDATLVKRRGSLPIEALTIGNSERYYKHARSTSIYTSAPKPRFKI